MKYYLGSDIGRTLMYPIWSGKTYIGRWYPTMSISLGEAKALCYTYGEGDP